MYYGYKSDDVFDYVSEGRLYMYMAGTLLIRRKTRNNQSINVSEDDHKLVFVSADNVYTFLVSN